jgi:hypothetical protein
VRRPRLSVRCLAPAAGDDDDEQASSAICSLERCSAAPPLAQPCRERAVSWVSHARALAVGNGGLFIGLGCPL